MSINSLQTSNQASLVENLGLGSYLSASNNADAEIFSSSMAEYAKPQYMQIAQVGPSLGISRNHAAKILVQGMTHDDAIHNVLRTADKDYDTTLFGKPAVAFESSDLAQRVVLVKHDQPNGLKPAMQVVLQHSLGADNNGNIKWGHIAPDGSDVNPPANCGVNGECFEP